MTHPKYPFVNQYHEGWAITARQVNAEFGFPLGRKVPADFYASRLINGHPVVCHKSRPGRHRMFTDCPICNKYLTVGCLDQHMRTMHT